MTMHPGDGGSMDHEWAQALDAAFLGSGGAGTSSARSSDKSEGMSSPSEGGVPALAADMNHTWLQDIDAFDTVRSCSGSEEISAPSEGVRSEHEEAGDGTAEVVLFDPGTDNLLELMHRSMRIPDEQLGEGTLDECNSLLDPDLPLGTVTGQAAMLDMGRKQLRERLVLLASCAVQLERASWRRCEDLIIKSIEAGTCVPIAYVDFAAYDSADFLLTAAQSVDIELPPMAGERELAACLEQGSEKVSVEEVSTEKKRVLQVEVAALLVVQRGDKYFAIRSPGLSWLQVTDRNTAECYKPALEEQMLANSDNGVFPHKYRVCCTDGASGISRTERHILESRDESWTLLHVQCRVHSWQNTMTQVYKVLQRTIAGMLALALALRAPGQQSAFRQASRRVLARTVQVVNHVTLTPEAKQYKDFVMRVFRLNTPEQNNLRFCLSRFAPGDWRRRDGWVCLAQPGESRADVLKAMFRLLVPALFGAAPTIFPRSRWVGADVTLRQIGVPLMVHGFLAASFFEYMGCDSSGKPQKGASSSRSAAASSADGGVSGGVGGGGGCGGIGDGEELQHDVAEYFGSEPQGGEQANGSAKTWAEQNRANRGTALEWLRTQPAVEVALMSMTMCPLMHAMHTELDMNGAEWDVQQDFEFLCAARPDTAESKPRHWPIVLAAAQTIEKKCAESIAEMHNVGSLTCLPSTHMHRGVESLACKLLTRSGASVHDYFIARFRRYPFRMFLLLHQPGIAAELEADCEHLRDKFSQEFWTRFQGRLHSDAAKAELLAIAATCRTATVRLECRNAQIRRFAVGLGLQTTRPELAALSARFLLKKMTNREKDLQRPAGSKRKAKAFRSRRSRKQGPKQVLKKTGKRRRFGGGGGWRAFCHSKRQCGVKADFKLLAEEYNELSPGAKARYARAGVVATMAHRGGRAAFGMMARQLQRAVARDDVLRRAEFNANAFSADGVGAAHRASNALAVPAAQLDGHIRSLRADRAALRKKQRQTLNERAERVLQWRQKEGVAIRDGAISCLPPLAPLAAGLCGRHVEGRLQLLDWVCPCSQMVPRIVAMLGDTRYAEVAETLVKDWKQKHMEKRHDDQPQLPRPRRPRARGRPSCFDIGMCFCFEGADVVYQFKRWLEDNIKALTKKGALQPKIDNLEVVFRVTQTMEAQPGDDDIGDAVGALHQEPEDSFLFIGLCSMSPYRPISCLCTLDDAAPDELGWLQLATSNKYVDLFELAIGMKDALRIQSEWVLHAFEVDQSSRPIAKVNPWRVLVRPIADLPPVARRFPRHPRQRQGAPRARAMAPWEAILDDLGLSDDDGDSASNEDAPSSAMSAASRNRSAGGSASPSAASESLRPSCASSGSLASPARPASPEEDWGGGHGDEGQPGGGDAGGSEVPGAGAAAEVEPPLDVVAVGPAPPVALDMAAAPRQPCDCNIRLPAGIIRYYLERREMVATCADPRHGTKCRFSRRTVGHPSATRAGQGRPVGLLSAWLAAGGGEQVKTAWDHVHLVMPSLEERRAGRLEVAHTPGGDFLMSMERPRRDGELEEPPTIP